MEHEENCPWGQNRGLLTTPLRRPCEVRKCAVWKDLKTWFGYTGASLPKLAFEEVFRDVAHGGSGLYERMAVEGGNMLREASRAFASKKAESNLLINSVAKQLFNSYEQKKAVGLVRQLYIQKEVTIMNDSSLLDYFAKSYLSAAQFLVSPRSVSNYVRVLLSFSLNEIAGQDYHKNPNEWLSTLLQHIYHSQAFRHLPCESDNQLLRDMFIFFDYQHDYFLPRIRECFDNLDGTSQASQVPGEELLVMFGSNYFRELYKAHHGSDRNMLADEFAQSQCREFIQSKAIELFACIFLRLHVVFIGEKVDYMTNRTPDDCRIIFMNLLGAYLTSGGATTDPSFNPFKAEEVTCGKDFNQLFSQAKVEEGHQKLPQQEAYMENVFQKTMGFFTQCCTPNTEKDTTKDNELPIQVKYDKYSKNANIRIPLGKLGKMEPVDYRTVLKRNGEKLMELAVSNNKSVPRLDVNI
ncbi:hypothetical protein BgAZ_102370 [Babesia gibsoni]|uniref:Uncharacterized protein n=1 Tax=Babesia gibsoni TaxID=33632 RepID=A0AAD8PFG2_BABGI|nr:hypothetical protein BgAZ_102370 [Babesia gibsoni]